MKTGMWTQLWLDYRKVNKNYDSLKNVVITGFSKENPVIQNAVKELERGFRGLLGECLPEIIFQEDAKRLKGGEFSAGNFCLKEQDGIVTLSATDENGILYAAFHLLRLIATEQELAGVQITKIPDAPLRMYNHWDNMDGSIERGYSGNSFFFEKDEVIINERTVDYARFMASIGINGVVINNVNVKHAATYLITERYLDKVARLSELFSSYGIKLFLSLN